MRCEAGIKLRTNDWRHLGVVADRTRLVDEGHAPVTLESGHLSAAGEDKRKIAKARRDDVCGRLVEVQGAHVAVLDHENEAGQGGDLFICLVFQGLTAEDLHILEDDVDVQRHFEDVGEL